MRICDQHRRIPGLCATEADFAELYSLLIHFRELYSGFDVEIDTLLEGIQCIFTSEYSYREPDEALQYLRNPRGAGRKTHYSDDYRQNVQDLYRKGMSIRAIAQKTGISKSTIQRILSQSRI